jgi:hypothetical protein|tara:strand:+ start:657 stop:863 length:207 start_codon:yes stop_codon:yes gene_type:complete
VDGLIEEDKTDSKPINWGINDDVGHIHTTQCCGSIVWIYTDYREDGEFLIPICFACKRRVTLEGEIIE